MRKANTIKSLAVGVRALEILARHAPLASAEFAHVAALDRRRAEALIDTFRQSGYVRQTPNSSLFVLTPMALAILGGGNPAGALAAQSIEAVQALAWIAGRPAAFSIRRGAEMLVCAGSQHELPGGYRVGDRMPVADCLTGLVLNGMDDPARVNDQRFGCKHDGHAIAVPVGESDSVSGVLSCHFDVRPDAFERAQLMDLLQRAAERLSRGELWPDLAFPVSPTLH